MRKRFLALLLCLLLLSGCRPIDAPDPMPPETSAKADTTAADATADTTPPAPEPETVTLVMVGDVLLHETVSESGAMADGSYNYDHLFANVQSEISEADIAIVNQEIILGGRELGLSGYPSFNGAFEVGDALAWAGFDVVLHATNHAMDRGWNAISGCLDFWRTDHPETSVLGIYDSTDAQNTIYVREENGIRIAILNYTYGLNGISLPEDRPYAVNLLEETKVRSDIAKAQALADFVVVCPHWGTEYVLEPDSYQTYWTNVFYECGVDLVLGTHPHVIEPVEMITGDAGEMLVYYSLGNYINATARTGDGVANQMVGAMAQVTVALDADGDAYIADYGVQPLVTHVKSGPGQITTYLLSDYTEALAKENEICAADPAFSLEYCKNLCKTVFGDLYE